MPENANRRSHLHQHLTRSRGRMPELHRALREHAERPLCAADCGWPVDSAAGAMHPGCEAPAIGGGR